MKNILVLAGNPSLANTVFGTLAATLPVIRSSKVNRVLYCDKTTYYVTPPDRLTRLRGMSWNEVYVIQPDMISPRAFREVQSQLNGTAYLWALPGVNRE